MRRAHAVLLYVGVVGAVACGCRKSAKREDLAPAETAAAKPGDDPVRLTEIPSEATGGDREVLAELAALRDRACACLTMDCIEATHGEIDMSTGALGATASQRLRDAASTIIDEYTGCTQWVREKAVFGKTSLPTGPAAARAYVDWIRGKRERATPTDVPALDEASGGFEDEGEGDDEAEPE